MPKLYLDLYSGISGDMFLGALLDLGVEFSVLQERLRGLGLHGYHLHVSHQVRGGISGVKFDVHTHAGEHEHIHAQSCQDPERPPKPTFGAHFHTDGSSDSHSHSHSHLHSHGQHDGDGEVHGDHGHHHDHDLEADHGHHHHGEEVRGYREIKQIIEQSQLSDWVKTKSLAIFKRIGDAEAKVHGKSLDEIHFHEVGALDSIVDIVGGCIALELLGCPEVKASNVVEGHGFVRCAHGQFAVPTAATLEIFAARQIAISQCDEPHELVTPTGAAILAEFVTEFGLMKGVVPVRIGYGLGSRENKTRPNVLRALLSSDDVSWPAAGSHTLPSGSQTDEVLVLESNLDDVTGEILGDFIVHAMADGALDVSASPIIMKKNRPGYLLRIICEPEAESRLGRLLLIETTAFGYRSTRWQRCKLKRESREFDTRHGKIMVKLGWLGNELVQVSPEFESCSRAATASGQTVRHVMELAKTVALGQL